MRTSMSQLSPGSKVSAIHEESPMIPEMSETWSNHSRQPSKHMDAVQVIMSETAEIENRLRNQTVELVTPTIKRQQVLDQKLKEVKAFLDDQYEDVNAMKRLLEGANAQHQVLENFRVEIAEKMTELQGFEQQVSTRISHQETQVNSIRQSLESKAGEAATTNRALESLSRALADSREETREVRGYTVGRIDTAEDRISKLRDEFETRMLQVEDRIQSLNDLQMGTTGSIGHVQAENKQVKFMVQECSSMMTELRDKKASIAAVEELHVETAAQAVKVEEEMVKLKDHFTTGLESVKAHLKTATETAGSSAALQMQLLRDQYDEEMKRMQKTAKHLEEFVEKSRGVVEETGAELAQVRAIAEACRAEQQGQTAASANIMDVNLKDLELSVAQLRTRQADMVELMHDQGRQHELRNDVLKILVEASLLSTVLEKQDDQDRKNIALFGWKADRTDTPREKQSASCSLPELGSDKTGAATALLSNRTPRRKPEATPVHSARGTPGSECTVTIDQRCLSCSGSPATVMAGFKMACLQYTPAPVEHRKKMYSRAELIQERADLLTQAKEQLHTIME